MFGTISTTLISSVADFNGTKAKVADLSVSAKSHNQILGNIVALYSLQGLNYVIPLFVLPFLVRTLGIEKFGLIAFAQSFAQYFTTFTDYGFNFSATRRIAQCANNATEVSRIFSAVLTIKALLMVGGAVMLMAIVIAFPRFRQEKALYLVGYMAVLGNVIFPTWLYQGMERMKYISIVSGIAKLMSATVLFVVIHKPDDYVLALGVQSGGLLFSGVIGLLVAFVRLKVRFCRPTFHELATALREGAHLFLSAAAVSLYTNTNIFLVGLLSGNTQAGYFSAADKLIRAMQALVTPFTQAIYPHVSYLAKQAPAEALRYIRQSLKLLSAGTLPPCVFMLACAPCVAHLCFGIQATGSIAVIRWIAMLPFFIAISNVLGIQTMVTFHMDKEFSSILLLAGVVNIGAAIPLISRFGASGAACAVLLTESFVTTTMVLVLMRSGIMSSKSQSVLL